MTASLVSSLLVAILVALFGFQNGDPVVVRFFRAQVHVSLGLALTLAAAAGMVAGLLGCSAVLIRKSMTIAALRKRVDAEERPMPR